MAAGRLIIPQYMPAEDANGDRIAGARLYFYDYDGEATTDLKAIYTTSALVTQHANPVVADASGIFPAIWADTAEEFTVVVADADAAPLKTYDAVSPSIDATLASVALAESAAERAETAEEGAEAALAAAEILLAEATGEPYSATSTTSLTIGTGSKSLTLAQAGKLFTVGQTLVIARTSAPSNQMTGILQTFNSETGAMTVDVATTAGAGTFADWSISLSSSGGVLSIAGETGVVTAAEAKAALAIAAADVTDFSAAVDTRAIAFAIVL